jgi:phosphoglycerol transferase
MRGRDADRWQQSVVALPLPEMVAALARVGFRGIYVDRFGYASAAQESRMEAQLARLLHCRPIESEEHRRVFFAMIGSRPAPVLTRRARRTDSGATITR